MRDDELPKFLPARGAAQPGGLPGTRAAGGPKLPLEAEMDAGALPEPASLAFEQEEAP